MSTPSNAPSYGEKSLWQKIFLFLSPVLVLGAIAGAFSAKEWWDNRPVYYRVAIDFDSRGQQGSLNAVVECQVHTVHPLGGVKDVGFMPGPAVYGVKLPDGTGVYNKVGTIETCSWAWTRTRKWPWVYPGDPHPRREQTGTPRLMWSPDFDKLASVEIYLGKASYQQPGANVTVRQARVTLATRQEYQDWIASVEGKPDHYLLRNIGGYTEDPNSFGYNLFVIGWCPVDVLIPEELWRDDARLKEWSATASEPLSPVPLAIFQEVTERKGYYHRLLDVPEQTRPDGDVYYRYNPLFMDNRDGVLTADTALMDSSEVLHRIAPITESHQGLNIESNRFGISSCYDPERYKHDESRIINRFDAELPPQQMINDTPYFDSRDNTLHWVFSGTPKM